MTFPLTERQADQMTVEAMRAANLERANAAGRACLTKDELQPIYARRAEQSRAAERFYHEEQSACGLLVERIKRERWLDPKPAQSEYWTSWAAWVGIAAVLIVFTALVLLP